MPGRNSCPNSLRFSEKSSTCYTETQFPTKIGPQSHTCSCVSEVQPWSCYHIPDQAQRRNRSLLVLTKPLVTEGMHLLLLCEVVCRRRKDRALSTVRPEVQGQCWTQLQPSPPSPPSPRPPCSSQWLSFCSWNMPRFLRNITVSLHWLFPLPGLLFLLYLR